MLEWFTASFFYGMAKDFISFLRGRRRKLSITQVIELRQKWKPLFMEEIYKNRQYNLREDVILRDIKRVDSYPETKDDRGISPWFKGYLLDTYHRGICLGINISELVEIADGKYRYADYKAGEIGGVNAYLIGKIPFERIEAVDWHGDEYYQYPHIYCRFEGKRKEPYEEIVFCKKLNLANGYSHYSEIAKYKDVKRNSGGKRWSMTSSIRK